MERDSKVPRRGGKSLQMERLAVKRDLGGRCPVISRCKYMNVKNFYHSISSELYLRHTAT